ncbi:MAG: HNH endonuclease [Candidatus Geothermincolia bacterium]
MGDRVLVLNASCQPLNVVSVRRAIVLVLKEKAEVLEARERQLHSQRMELPSPLVIRLSYLVKVPYRTRTSISRRAVFVRDGFTCQYCGGKAESIDHVLPRSRGGLHAWDNVVAACRRCNTRKENRLLAEAGLRLRTIPVMPHDGFWLMVAMGEPEPSWERYIGAFKGQPALNPA